MTANQIARDKAAVRRVDEINEEIRAKGPRIAPGVFFYEADQRIKCRLFFSLGSQETISSKISTRRS